MTPDRLDRMRQVQLRAEYVSPAGDDTLLWVTSLVDEDAQTMRVVTWADTLDVEGTMLAPPLPHALAQLDDARAGRAAARAEAGFTVEACLGDFDGTPFDAATAEEQIWIARKHVAA